MLNERSKVEQDVKFERLNRAVTQVEQKLKDTTDVKEQVQVMTKLVHKKLDISHYDKLYTLLQEKSDSLTTEAIRQSLKTKASASLV
jgi:hypothetical protein